MSVSRARPGESGILACTGQKATLQASSGGGGYPTSSEGQPVQRVARSSRGPRRAALTGANVKRFRGGLVFKVHRFLYHSTLGLRVIKKKKKKSGARECFHEPRPGESGTGTATASGCTSIRGVNASLRHASLCRCFGHRTPPHLWQTARPPPLLQQLFALHVRPRRC